jgi:hypothetical protein
MICQYICLCIGSALSIPCTTTTTPLNGSPMSVISIIGGVLYRCTLYFQSLL